MKKSILSIALITLISFTSCKNDSKTETTEEAVTEVALEPTYSGTYTLDSASSSVAWVGSKPAGKHTGTITVKDGSFDITDSNITGGTFTLDMNSINVTDIEGEDKEHLEIHLKGTGDKKEEDHFFNTTKFPTGTFKIKTVTEVEGVQTVTGDLTLKDITKEVSFPAEVTVSETEVSLVSSAFKIDRTLWGVNYASKSIFDNLKDKFVDDEIELTVNVKAKK